MMKKIKSAAGFTLIEMMVVIAVIGILVSVLVVSLGNSTDKARAIKCATNMKNLAAGVSSYTLANDGYFPYAQSAQYIGNDMSDAGNLGVNYGVHKGWISYLDRDVKYPLKSPGSYTQLSLGASDPEDIRHALTNGAIWQAVGCNPDTFVCPSFKEEARKRGIHNPGWSYHMSAFFGYEEQPGKATHTKWDAKRVTSLAKADRTLLFAEIQGLSMSSPKVRRAGVELPNVDFGNTSNGSKDLDGCLWYKSAGGNESIGFNHVDSRAVFGHVAFADGHVETFKAPKDGRHVDLTDWLCCGKDVTYHGGNYDEINAPAEPQQ